MEVWTAAVLRRRLRQGVARRLAPARVRPRHKFRANLGLWPDFRAEATLWAKF